MVYRNPYDGYSEEGGGYSCQEEYAGCREPDSQYYTHQAQVAGWSSESGCTGGTYTRRQSRRNQQADSQAALIPPKDDREVWPRPADHLFSSWAFSLSLHSLWTLPPAVAQHGGLAFLLAYAAAVALVGAPLLLLEVAIGQYSGLPTSVLFRHLFPLLAGLGLSIPLMAILRAMLDLGVLMWSGRGLFHLFSYQAVSEGFFTKDILAKSASNLDQLGDLNHQLLLVLGIAAITTFVCVVASTKSVGKACMVAVPTAFMLLVSLTIRACLAPGAPNAVLHLLTPDWEALTRPSTWLEATAQAVFSLQLGLGAFSTFASYSRFSSNLVRDTAIMTVAHLVWVLLSTVLTFSLIGLAQLGSYPPNNGLPRALMPDDVDTGIWLAAATLLEKAFATLSYGWLWAGLYFILIILVGVTSLFGYVEVVTSSLFSLKPSMGRFKPLIAFLVLAVLFLADLVLATAGGIHIYHLLISYIASWPALLFSFLTLIATLLCHGVGHLMRDVADMARLRLHHWVTSHLATIYYTLLPVALMACVTWQLHKLLMHLPLSLPQWALPLPFSLAALPLAPVLLGAFLQIIWLRRGVPLNMHLKRLFKATDRYYKNEHLANAATSRSSIKRASTIRH